MTSNRIVPTTLSALGDAPPLREVQRGGIRLLLSSAAASGVLALHAVASAQPVAQSEQSGAQRGAPSPAPPASTPSAPAGVLTKPPELLHFVEAPFPESERETTTQAGVVLELVLDREGAVSDARIAESAGAAFDAAALEAARGFRFSPAEIDGSPAPIKIQYRYEFRQEVVGTTEATLRGVVRDRESGQPLGGVSVRLDTGHESTTDEQGRFELMGVPAGERTVWLSGQTIASVQTSEILREGSEVTVQYDLSIRMEVAPGAAGEELDDLEILIVAPKRTLEVVSTRVEAESARRVAGTQGDVLKVVENLPGVARAAVGSGDVIVWGAAPQDTRVYVDGVRVPALYHYGGFRSVVHSDLVRSVELVPGGYGAGYGRGLGGLVTVSTRDPSEDDFEGSLQLDVLDAALALHGPVSDSVRFSAAIRRSHVSEVFSGVASDEAQGFFSIPTYYDGSARVRYAPASDWWVEIGGMISSDRVDRTIGADNPASRRSEQRQLDFERVFVRYQAEPDEGSRITLVPWFGRDDQRLRGVFAGVPVAVRGSSNLYGLRASWAGQAAENVVANIGFDVEAVQGEYHREGALGAPAREGDVRVFGQPPADQVNVDTWKAVTGSAAPYAEVDIALLDDRLHLVPGLRLEPFFASVNRRRPAEGSAVDVGAFDAELSLQPRFSVRYALDPRVLLKGAYGRYRQPAPAEDLSSVFGNPLLGTAQATHYLLAGEFKWTQYITAETTVFHAHSEDLAVRNPLPSPRVSETLVAKGAGRSYGIQLLLRRELVDGLMGWIAYTLLRSERKDGVDEPWRLFDYDQTHVLTALASQELGRGFEIGARARLVSGYPRTPVVGAYYDARRDQFEPVLGAHNSERIPGFWQLDVRASKRWKLGSSELEAYLDVLNVVNRENAEEIAYSTDYAQRRYIYGLPILPVLGAKWSF